jgi:ubiquinone/menaquinone biosynthesis C-methylase UbiE
MQMSALNDTYWDKHAAGFASHRNEEMAKFIRDLALSLRVSSVLEVGCSAGNDLSLFPKDHDVNGIDKSEFAINIARQNLPFKFRVGLATSLPYDDSSVDLVFTRNVLNYIESPDVDQVLRELFRVSKKYILNVELFSDEEQQITDESITTWGRNMQKRWSSFQVKIISNVDLHQDIDPKKSRFTLVKKIQAL